MARSKILIVDDEVQIRESLIELFGEEFRSKAAANGDEALRIVDEFRPDLILLDIIMPGIDGLEICKRLRSGKEPKKIPILFLSAADASENRIKAFELDADDFIPKPFDTDELLARIRSKLRRFHSKRYKSPTSSSYANLTLDPNLEKVTLNGIEVQLTALEYKLVTLLLERPGEIVSRPSIVRRIWNNKPGSERLIDAHMTSLRKRLSDFAGEITTTYGRGYRLVATPIEPQMSFDPSARGPSKSHEA